ncbi:unknown [Firmicutes bacterium CAG:137]|nr:unknown [Firmicutes bacterium CAG:137]
MSKACALPQNGPVVAAAGFLLQRLCGGHEEALDQMTAGYTGLLIQLITPDVSGNQGGHAGHLGGRHGGAGHVLIGGTSRVHALDAVDAAAGGCDFRFHGEVSGYAVRGEGAHGVILRGGLLGAGILAHGEGSLIVRSAARRGFGRSRCPENRPFFLGDCYTGLVIPVSRQVHAQSARYIIINDGGNGPVGGGGIGLFIERGLASGADGDFSFQLPGQGHPVRLRTGAVNEDVGMLPSQGLQGAVAVVGVLIVEDVVLPGSQVHAGVAGVIH